MTLRRGLRGRDVGAAGLGAAAGLLVLIAQMVGVLGGMPLLALSAIAMLAVPCSRSLNGRLLLAGCTALGWLPLLWVARWPVHVVTRLGTLTAVILLALVTWVARADSGARLKRLLPRVGVNELGVAVASAYSVWLYLPMLRAQDAGSSLRLLGLGWDFAAHYDMAEMILRGGSMTSTNWPPSDHWAYASYPRGSHAVTATVQEVLGAGSSAVGGDLAPYVHAVAIVSIVAIIAVVAGLGELPALRGRPVLASLSMALALLAFTTGRGGGELIITGFPNFLVACALLACVPLLVVPLDRLDRLGPLAALSGVLVGIAHSWALLLAPAAVGALVALLPVRRGRWPKSIAGWVALALIAVATLIGLLTAWMVLRSGSGSGSGVSREFVLIAGPVSPATPSEIALAGSSALIAALGVLVLRKRIAARGTGPTTRTMALAAVVIGGWALAAAIAAYQLQRVGALWYYFWKYATAMQLLSVVIALTGVAALSRRASSTGRTPRLLAVALLVVLIPVVSGVVGRSSSGFAVMTPAGLHAREQWQLAARADRHQDPRSVALGNAFLAARVAELEPELHVMVPASLDNPVMVRLQNVWLFALTHRWSAAVFEAVEALWGDNTRPEDRPPNPHDAVIDLQERLPHAVVLVPTETWEALVEHPDPRVDMGRLRRW